MIDCGFAHPEDASAIEITENNHERYPVYPWVW